MLSDIKQLAKELDQEEVSIPLIEVKQGSLGSIPSYTAENSFENVLLVADENTYEAAGRQLAALFDDQNTYLQTVMMKPNKHGQVIADEATLIQLFAETPKNTDLLIAVGSGTLHDIVRFVGDKMDIPFISVPTAASVDGFTSKGAPLIFRGNKQTVQASSPLAIFADIDILRKAPKEMTAAGFGDILGKYTSLLDWKISDLIGKEPYNQLAAAITRKSLDNCVANVDKIAAGEEEGLQILIESLIESGLVMLLLDFSRPASGGEHHLSHYWEMELLKQDAEQLLHGTKVGVTTTIITELYKNLAQQLDVNTLSADFVYYDALKAHWTEIQEHIEKLPSPGTLQSLLKTVGGSATSAELGVTDELVEDSLNEAFHLRERCTGLLLANRIKKDRINYPLSTLPV